MWRFDRTRVSEVVRAGRMAVERWTVSRAGLVLHSTQVLPADHAPSVSDLIYAISALYREPPRGKVTLVLESAWLPAVLVDTGGRLLSATQLQILVRHRFALLYDQTVDPVIGWDLRIDHRAGERHALGFALSVRLKEELAAAGSTFGVDWKAMAPAFAWGREQLRAAHLHRQRSSWWAWIEQDRVMLAYQVGGRVAGLHPAMPYSAESGTILEQTRTEAVRLGIAAAGASVHAGHWGPRSHLSRTVDEPVRWWGLGAPASAALLSAVQLHGGTVAA